MTRISSRWTWFHKRLFPVIWLGVIAIAVGVPLLTGAPVPNAMFYVIPAFVAVLGFALWRKLLWDLADEVYDCGDELLVRNAGREERVALTNVINVSASLMINPPRISLRLDKPGRFGNEIVFSPQRPTTLNPFAKSAIAEDLMLRVDRARTRRAR